MNIGLNQIIYYVINAVTIIIAITVFEFTKALLSTLQGDAMPKNQGKLTLNPLKFFEPIGFLIFLFCGYGWGNPVETSSRNYKNKKRGILITYVTPIVICIILAMVFKVVLNIAAALNTDYLTLIPAFLSRNLAAIAVFNIIPVYPMAGSNIIRCFLNPNQAVSYSQYEKPLQILVVFLLLLGILSKPLNAIVNILV